jgi:malonate transporter
VGKLVFLPISVWLGLCITALVGAGMDDPDLQKAAIIIAATPAMSIYSVLAQQHGQEQQAATAMLLMTAMSFVT